MTSEKVIPRMERVGWLTYSFFFVCFIYFSYMEKNGSFVGGLEYIFFVLVAICYFQKNRIYKSDKRLTLADFVIIMAII